MKPYVRTEDEKIRSLSIVASELMPRLPYHNFNHAIDVYTATQMYGAGERVNHEDIFILASAAMLHDIIYVKGNTDNEERSAEFATRYLPIIGYSTKQVDKAAKLILATKMPQNPKDPLEEIIADSDLDNLGRKDFFVKGEMLRIELGISDKQEWYRAQLKFLESHNYFTKSAREIRNAGKQRNMVIIQEYIRKYDVNKS